MIIINSHSKIKYNQHIYNNIIHSINLSSIECTQCHCHDWSFHASYSRHVDFFNRMIKLTITRIICHHCHITHAILIEDMIPYSLLSFDDIFLSLHDNSLLSSHVFYLYKKYKDICFSYTHFCLSHSRNFPCLFIST